MGLRGHNLFPPFENGAFIIADRTTTLVTLIIFVTLLNALLLILIERPKPCRIHAFLSVFNCFAFFRYPSVKM